MPMMNETLKAIEKIIPSKKTMEYLGDIKDVRWVILYVGLGAFVIGFLNMILIRWFAGCII